VASVLFAHGHLLRRDAKQFAIGKPYPPLATLYAAAHARALGHQIALYDPMLDDDVSSFGERLDRVKPDVVVLYDDAFNWFTKMCLSRMREAAWAMIAQARTRRIPVVVAGHDAADDPEAYLRAGAGFVLLGEGEVTLGELLGHLDGGASSIPGLAFLHRGLLRRTEPRKLLRDLDVLPLPAWDVVEIERYRAFWLKRHGYFSLNLVTTRGCPYLCNWCAKPTYGNTYHSRSPGNVVAEMRLLRERYGPDHFWFCDDILGLKSKWLVAWSQAVADAGLATPFLCQTRADLMTEENVAALRRAGAHEVWLGAESGSQAILDAMQKGISVDDTRGAVGRLRRHGVRVGLFLQFGYAGERWSDVQATRALVRELLPDDIGISVSYPLPGTRYYELMSARLGEKRNWAESSDLDPLVPSQFSADFYRTLSRVVHAELRFLRGARALRAIAKGKGADASAAVNGAQEQQEQPALLGAPARAPLLRGIRRAVELRHFAPWVVQRLRLAAAGRRRSASGRDGALTR
jgi:anaerobic magnesium-protoporphyrin IX monomethyl ester cyclase